MRGSHGMTLLDTLVGLGIAIFLMSALAIFVLFQNRKLGAETRTVAADQELRAALELISGDLREAGRRSLGLSYASNPAPPGLCETDSNRLRVTLDRDGDGTTTGPGEDVTYCICRGAQASVVYRAYRLSAGSTYAVEPVADDVGDLRFTYSPRSVLAAMTVTVATPLGSFSRSAQVETYLRNFARKVTCAAAAACPPAGCGA